MVVPSFVSVKSVKETIKEIKNVIVKKKIRKTSA